MRTRADVQNIRFVRRFCTKIGAPGPKSVQTRISGLAILAPTCLPEAIHIPSWFREARTPDMIRNEAARYWKARGT